MSFNIDWEKKRASFKVLRKHILVDKHYILSVFDSYFVMSEGENEKIPKY